MSTSTLKQSSNLNIIARSNTNTNLESDTESGQILKSDSYDSHSHFANRADSQKGDQKIGGEINEHFGGEIDVLSDSLDVSTMAEIAQKVYNLKKINPKDFVMSHLRSIIDCIDSQLLELLFLRMSCSKMVGAYKKTKNLPIFDPKREIILVDKVLKISHNKLNPDFVKSLYDLILEESKRLQK